MEQPVELDHPALAERGLTPETLTDFGVGFCAKGMMIGRLAIPIHNPQGEVVAYAGRQVGEPKALSLAGHPIWFLRMTRRIADSIYGFGLLLIVLVAIFGLVVLTLIVRVVIRIVRRVARGRRQVGVSPLGATS